MSDEPDVKRPATIAERMREAAEFLDLLDLLAKTTSFDDGEGFRTSLAERFPQVFGGSEVQDDLRRDADTVEALTPCPVGHAVVDSPDGPQVVKLVEEHAAAGTYAGTVYRLVPVSPDQGEAG